MTNGPIAEYQTAVQEFAAATERAQRVADQFVEIGDKFHQWWDIQFANAPSAGRPLDRGERTSINYREVPSFDGAIETIRNWDDAHAAMQNAYQAIPEGERAVVTAPAPKYDSVKASLVTRERRPLPGPRSR